MKDAAQTEDEKLLADVNIAVANMMKNAESKSSSVKGGSYDLYSLLDRLNGTGDRIPLTNPSDIAESLLPETTELFQNYPNPFNPVTQIKFALARTADIKLSVYNISGQKVAELANGSRQAGHHAVDFDGSKLNSGIYFYTLEVEGKTLTRKMLLTK